MKLTPIEIKQQHFEKSLRGYDVAEVKSFLNLVSNQVEQLITKNQDLSEEIEKLTGRLKHYERVEEALHETIKTTKETVDNKIGQAEKEAQLKIDKAALEAENIIQEALRYRQQVKQNVLSLLDKREEIIAGISSYLERAKGSLNQFSKDEFNIYKLEDDEPEKPKSFQQKEKFQLDTDSVEKKEEINNASEENNTENHDDIDTFDDIDNLLDGIE